MKDLNMGKIALIGALLGGAYLVYRNLDVETKNKVTDWFKGLKDQLPDSVKNMFGNDMASSPNSMGGSTI